MTYGELAAIATGDTKNTLPPIVAAQRKTNVRQSVVLRRDLGGNILSQLSRRHAGTREDV